MMSKVLGVVLCEKAKKRLNSCFFCVIEAPRIAHFKHQKMSENTRLIFAQRAVDSLLIAHHQGGWITTHIMANAFWPKSPTRKKYAERLMAEMIRQGLLLKRQLPNRMSAGVITAQGCKYINETMWGPGIKVTMAVVRPGTDWGSTNAGKWLPPASWRHQLRAGAFVTWAANAFGTSFSMLFDTQIQRCNQTALKRPDGIIYGETPKGKFQLWIEVESARKTGPEMSKLVAALVDVQSGNAPQMFDFDEYGTPSVVNCRHAALVVPKGYSVESFRKAVAKRLHDTPLKVMMAEDQEDGTFSAWYETIEPL